MFLTGPQLGEVADLLVASFSERDLKKLLLIRLNLQFDAIVAAGPLETRVLDLVVWANQNGIISDLVRAAFADKPKVPEWQALDARYGAGPVVAVQQAGTPTAVLTKQAGRPTTAALEGIVKTRLPIVDMPRWRAREAAVEAQVCRIDIGSTPKGTGFLVGPDLVLTNHHVLRSVIESSALASSVRCVFDYKRLTDGNIQQGRSVRLAADWLVDKAPPSQAEIENHPDDAIPTVDELDFALIRLAEPIGAAPIATAKDVPRGWVKLPSAQPPLPKNGPIIIVQHPNADPVSMALDTEAIIGVNANDTRVRYATNTEGGSSGSPCFDFSWSLVALHHLGDPNGPSPQYNEGVPIGLIADRIAQFVPAG